MSIINLPQEAPSNEILPQLRVAFKNRDTVVVGGAMVDYSPYEGLRYAKGDVFYIAEADGEVESIPASAQRAYAALFTEVEPEVTLTGTVAVRTSRIAAHVLEMVWDSDDTPGCLHELKITSSRVGGYVHVPMEHKEEVLDLVSCALDIAGEQLYGLEDWEDNYDDAVKEVADLETLYDRVEAL